jgi:hypothetical protein
MRKTVFTIDDNKLAYIGYTIGEKWKHYDVPYFDIDAAIKIVEEFNTIAEYPIIYDSIYDQFYLYDEGNKEYEIYKPKEFKTAGGIKKLYPIKGWYWQWEEFTEGNIQNLAEGIEDWLWEFDTYAYWDCFGIEWDREFIVMKIKAQLKELETLAKTIKIYYSDILSAEEKYNALREGLKV